MLHTVIIEGGQRQSLPRTSHSTTSNDEFQPPQVIAVFPTVVLVHWQAPIVRDRKRAKGAGSPATADEWQYTVEWNCTCAAHTGQPNTLLTKDCWLLLPRQHPYDGLYIRVVAKQGDSKKAQPHTSPTRVASSHLTIAPTLLADEVWRERSPWLRPAALSHPCLFDALVLAMHTTSAVAAMPPQRRESLHLTGKGVVRLHDTTFSVVSALYATVEPPLCTAAVQYYVACTIPAGRDVDNVSLGQMLSTLETGDGLTVVLCGYGELAQHAVTAAHTVLGECARSGRADLCARVLCTAFAAPPEASRGAPLSSARYAGHILFYTLSAGCPAVNLPQSGLASAANYVLPSSCGTAVFSAGVHAQIVTNAATGRSAVEGTAPCFAGTDLPSLAPVTSTAGLADLVRLCNLALPFAPHLLEPVVDSAEMSVCAEDGTVLAVVRGHNLHYDALVCAVEVTRGVVLPMTLADAAPHMLIARAPLMGCLCLVHQTDADMHASPHRIARLHLRLTVSTAMGSHTCQRPSILEVHAPFALARLACLARTAPLSEPLPPLTPQSRAAWLVDVPSVFLPKLVTLQPFQYDTPTSLRSAVRSTVGLNQLCSCAELARHYYDKATANPFRTFLSNVASKVAAPATTRRQNDVQPAALEVPDALEAAYFMTSLGHGVALTCRDMSTYRDRSRSSIQRLFSTLVWLGDAELYERKLLSLLTLFECADNATDTRSDSQPSPETLPLVALEQRLYACLAQHLQAASAAGVAHGTQSALTETMSFEQFYRTLHRTLLAAVPLERPMVDQLAAEIVLEAAAVWSYCLLYEMRCDAALAHTVVVVGDGANASAVASAVRAVWGELVQHWAADGATSPKPRLCVRCVPRRDVTLLSDALAGKVLDSLLIVGEACDYQDGTMSSCLRTLEASASAAGSKIRRRRHGRHFLLVKADEAIHTVRQSSSDAVDSESPEPAGGAEFWEARLAADADRLLGTLAEKAHAIALTPSPTSTEAYLRACKIDATSSANIKIITEAWRQISHRTLLHLLTADMQMEDVLPTQTG